MELTFQLAQEFLQPLGGQAQLLQQESKSFQSVRLLPQYPEPLDPDHLYIVLWPLPLGWIAILDKTHYIVCDRSSEIPDCNRIVLPDGLDLFGVCNRLQAYSTRLLRWGMEMERIIAADGSLQEMMDESEGFFQNPIFIMSRSLQLMAHTKGIPTAHPDLQLTVESGYFPQHMVRDLIERKILQTTESFRQLGFFYPPNYVNGTLVIRAYETNALRLNTVCLYGLNTEPTQGDFDKMKFVTDCIERYILKSKHRHLSGDLKDAHLIIDIIEVKTDKTEVKTKFPLTQLNFQGRYRLFRVFFDEYIASQADYIMQELQSLMPYATVFLYNSTIVMLLNEERIHDVKLEYLPVQIEEILSTQGIHCGTSEQFSDLMGARPAYYQCNAAAELGRLLHPEKNLHLYRDYYVYHLVDCCAKDVGLPQLYDRRLDKVIEYDQKRGADNLLLLETLLDNERNITATAAQMHLHRNSVLYRLDRIESMMDCSLDDAETRLRLHISMKALRLLRAREENA